MSKRIGVFAVLSLFLVFPVSASMVSFLVVETGIGEDVPQNQISSLWEGGIMAAFFDAGHIVTDNPITRIEKRPSRDLSGPIETDFNEAASMGAEYYVLGFIAYENQGGRAEPISISLKLFKIDSKKLIAEKEFPVGNGKSLAEEHKNAQNAGRVIISYM